jgi:hypothetical protein
MNDESKSVDLHGTHLTKMFQLKIMMSNHGKDSTKYLVVKIKRRRHEKLHRGSDFEECSEFNSHRVLTVTNLNW